jgi:hypothetical protein
MRKLTNSSKITKLSKVYPSILDGIIIKALLQEGVRLTSIVLPFKAGFATEQFACVFSNRRQIYFNPENTKKVPDSISVNFEHTVFRIFLM